MIPTTTAPTAQADTDQAEPVLDLRAIPPYQRHQLIFASVQDLTPGDGFSLVNDHDPRPLHHQLLSLFGAGFSWEYLQRGPEVWQVRIARPEGAAATSLRVRVDRNGDVTVAAADARLGPDGSGASVCEVTDVPPGTLEGDVLALLQGVIPPAGVVSIAYERLLARRNGSCCGGMCG
ncbi:uncharacterized protein (DUF2249 family) [Azospirillum lipoferum]|uniref:DUF2249 domain-containing protein n=1 Tax=Azospirillum lipoferum TaxID=193 RepID=A0A5A9FYS9_AZOLI|nr:MULTISPECIES: DUF2249 domain-containing protein [Azospirillum]KAA0587191.1 DUF2249 domain-containing protein [Azospirillum lipoferum]MCP1615120.1 uncharacterized protein (DUF2249 family) [Azospirillum lipoferum]MDW5533017.1 DUF2249 domain-containing protein [Azospirillum sp. NL1]